jgi:hypothetical protein
MRTRGATNPQRPSSGATPVRAPSGGETSSSIRRSAVSSRTGRERRVRASSPDTDWTWIALRKRVENELLGRSLIARRLRRRGSGDQRDDPFVELEWRERARPRHVAQTNPTGASLPTHRPVSRARHPGSCAGQARTVLRVGCWSRGTSRCGCARQSRSCWPGCAGCRQPGPGSLRAARSCLRARRSPRCSTHPPLRRRA